MIKFLGRIISEDGIMVDPEKIEAVKFLKEPKDVKQLRTFLGIVGYYRKFVKKFGIMAQPLYQLLKKGRVYKWDDGCSAAFDMIKEALCSAPILGYPDFTKPFILDADASGYGVGATLSQRTEVEWEFEDITDKFIKSFLFKENEYDDTLKKSIEEKNNRSKSCTNSRFENMSAWDIFICGESVQEKQSDFRNRMLHE